jgi:ferredoxin
MRVKVDSDLCQGHGRCYVLYPQLFESDDEGYSVPKDLELTGELGSDARQAVDVCPECAISIAEGATER